METILEHVRNKVTKICYRSTDDGLWQKNNMTTRNKVAKINYRFTDVGLWEKNTMTNAFQFTISLLREKMETIIEQVRNMVTEIYYRFTDDGLWEKYNMIILILILVGFPVADCNHQDFKWLPTKTTVKGVYQTDVQLVWKYQSNLKFDKIDISREKTKYEKEDVALWTPDEGSKPNTLLSTDVTLKHRKEGDVGTIILTLINPYPVDFDKQYYCGVCFDHGVDFMEIELQPYKVEYQPVDDVVKARPGDDVQFVWIYKYQLPLTVVEFYKNDDIQNDILRWSRSDGVYDIEDEYKNRVDVNITTNNGQEEVTLTLRNVTKGDFDHKYCSLAIPANGYYSVSKITLRRLPVEEEKLKPVQETISTPSSASRLSQVPICLICSVLLLAV